MNVVHELTTNGIGFRVLTGQGANIDTTTSSSFSMSSFKRAIGASALDTCVTTRAASASAAQVRASAAAQQRDWLADGSQPTQRNGNDGRGSAQDGWRPSRPFGRRTNRRPALR